MKQYLEMIQKDFLKRQAEKGNKAAAEKLNEKPLSEKIYPEWIVDYATQYWSKTADERNVSNKDITDMLKIMSQSITINQIPSGLDHIRMVLTTDHLICVDGYDFIHNDLIIWGWDKGYIKCDKHTFENWSDIYDNGPYTNINRHNFICLENARDDDPQPGKMKVMSAESYDTDILLQMHTLHIPMEEFKFKKALDKFNLILVKRVRE